MTQVDDLSRSLAVFDQNTSLLVVVELSEASWLIAGLVPGVLHRPQKKLAPDSDALLQLLERWQAEAVRAGQTIGRIALAYEAGRDGLRLRHEAISAGRLANMALSVARPAQISPLAIHGSLAGAA